MFVAVVILFQPFQVRLAAANSHRSVKQDGLPEVYRFRIANTLHGAVEISVDKGKSYHLIARVIKPAVDRAPGGQSSLPVVERGGVNTYAFGVGGGRMVRVLPDMPANRRDPTGIVINLTPTNSIFKELLPPVGSVVQQVINERASPLPPDYTLSDGDRFLITASRSEITQDTVPSHVMDAESEYQKESMKRWKSEGKKITSGFVTVNVKLAEGDAATAITWLLDGSVAGIQNRGPYSMKFDTRKWRNGEHLIEARALDGAGLILTYKKTLIVTENTP